MIFGRPGSGKSTFALEAGKNLKLPVHHLDRYFYTHNWVEQDYPIFLKIQQDLVDQKNWIIDGNCIRSLEMRYKRATIALYFNYPRLPCLGRIIRRIWNKNPHIKDRAPNCPEQLSWKLIKHIWTMPQRIEATLPLLRKQYPHVLFYEINNDQDLKKIIKSF